MDLEAYILGELKRKNMRVMDAIELLGISKPTFYSKIKAAKPDADFLTKVKTQLNIDVSEIDGHGSAGEQKQPNPRLTAIPTRLYADPLDWTDKKQKLIVLPDGSKALRVQIVHAKKFRTTHC